MGSGGIVLSEVGASFARHNCRPGVTLLCTRLARCYIEQD